MRPQHLYHIHDLHLHPCSPVLQILRQPLYDIHAGGSIYIHSVESTHQWKETCNPVEPRDHPRAADQRISLLQRLHLHTAVDRSIADSPSPSMLLSAADRQAAALDPSLRKSSLNFFAGHTWRAAACVVLAHCPLLSSR